MLKIKKAAGMRVTRFSSEKFFSQSTEKNSLGKSSVFQNDFGIEKW